MRIHARASFHIVPSMNVDLSMVKQKSVSFRRKRFSLYIELLSILYSSILPKTWIYFVLPISTSTGTSRHWDNFIRLATDGTALSFSQR